MSVFVHPRSGYIEFRAPADLPFSQVEQARQSLGFFLEQYAVPFEGLKPVTLDARHADRVNFAIQILTALHPCPAQMAAGCRSLAEPPGDDEAEGYWVAPGGALALRVCWNGLEELETCLDGLFEMLEKHAVSSNASQHTVAGLVWLTRWLLPTAADFEGMETEDLEPFERDFADYISGRCRADFQPRLQAAEGLAVRAAAPKPAVVKLTRHQKMIAAAFSHLAEQGFLNPDSTAEIHRWLAQYLETGVFPPLPFAEMEQSEGEAAADHETKSPPTAANGDGLQRGF